MDGHFKYKIAVALCVRPVLYASEVLSATTVSGTMVPGMGPPIYCAAFAGVFGAAFTGRRAPHDKKRPILYILPFFFGAALGCMYQMTSQTINCAPHKLMDCVVPIGEDDTSCADFAKYNSCVYASGCWKVSNLHACRETNTALGCDNRCYGNHAHNKV